MFRNVHIEVLDNGYTIKTDPYVSKGGFDIGGISLIIKDKAEVLKWIAGNLEGDIYGVSFAKVPL